MKVDFDFICKYVLALIMFLGITVEAGTSTAIFAMYCIISIETLKESNKSRRENEI